MLSGPFGYLITIFLVVTTSRNLVSGQTGFQKDIAPPVVSCGPDILRVTSASSGGISVYFLECTATDDFGTVTLIRRSRAPGSFFPIGITTVTYTFVDGNGNTAIGSFVVEIVAVQCGPDIQRKTLFTTGGLHINFAECTTSDTTGRVTLVSRSHTPGDFFPIGVAVVTYTFSDPTGNTASESFTIKINAGNITLPIVCSPDIIRVTPASSGGIPVNFEECRATDDFGNVNGTLRSHTPGSFFHVGNTTVTYTFSGANGITAVGSFVVAVVAVQCGPDIVRKIPFSSRGLNINFADCTTSDTTGRVILVSRSHTPGQFFSIGLTVITYTFSDPTGNTASESFTITVNGAVQRRNCI